MSSKSVARPLIFAAAPVAIAGGYSIKAKGKTAEIILYGDVGDSYFGGVTAKQFADDLKAAGNVDTITLRINSAGGDVFDGLTIYRRLVDHPAKIVVHIDGVAASIASVIAMAGNEINISESGFVMIHNAWGLAIGDAADMRTTADLLDTVTGSIRDVYAARTKNTVTAVKKWMDEETWFTAAEAKDSGFVDNVTDNLRIAARIDPAKHKFRKAPQSLAASPNADALRARLAAMKAKIERRRAA